MIVGTGATVAEAASGAESARLPLHARFQKVVHNLTAAAPQMTD